MKKLEIKNGEKFGKLEIIEEVSSIISSNKPRRVFKCMCECGNTIDVQLSSLRTGHTTSCGCYQKQKAKEGQLKHGLADNHPLYVTWKNIKKRCYYKSAPQFKDYGGRGITMDELWKNDFQEFYNWAINNNWNENLTIDRVDVDGNYVEENCRWVDMKTQANNTRKNHYIDYNGQKFTLSTLSDYLNIPYNIVRYRISTCKYSVEQLINYYNDRNQNK